MTITVLLKDPKKYRAIEEGSLLEVTNSITVHFTSKLMSGIGRDMKPLSRSKLEPKRVEWVTVRLSPNVHSPSVTRQFLGYTVDLEKNLYVLHLGEKKE